MRAHTAAPISPLFISFILPYTSPTSPLNLDYVYPLSPRRVRTCLRSLLAVSAVLFVLLAVAGS